MSKGQDAKFDATIEAMHNILEIIDKNGRDVQSQIDEIKSGIYELKERVANLEQKTSRYNTVRVPLIENAEVKKIVREVLQEQGAVLQQTKHTAVLDKTKVYECFDRHGYTKHQALRSLNEANVLITGNDGNSCRVVWDGKNQKPFRAIVIKLCV